MGLSISESQQLREFVEVADNFVSDIFIGQPSYKIVYEDVDDSSIMAALRCMSFMGMDIILKKLVSEGLIEVYFGDSCLYVNATEHTWNELVGSNFIDNNVEHLQHED